MPFARCSYLKKRKYFSYRLKQVHKSSKERVHDGDISVVDTRQIKILMPSCNIKIKLFPYNLKKKEVYFKLTLEKCAKIKLYNEKVLNDFLECRFIDALHA
jgi:hypothetical protein